MVQVGGKRHGYVLVVVNGQHIAKSEDRGWRRTADVGGHMYIRGKRAQVNFILPICSSCNNNRNIDYNGAFTRCAYANSNALLVPIPAHECTFER